MDAGKLRWCWLQLGDAALMLQEFRKEGHDSWVPDGKVGLGVSLCFRCKDAVAIYREVRARGIEACARRGSPDPAAPRTDRSPEPFETFRSSVSGRSETCPELSTVVVSGRAESRPLCSARVS